jgi:hypothetical protein
MRIYLLLRAIHNVVLLTLVATATLCGQNHDWTVTWFEGSSGEPCSLTDCRLVAVTLDSLQIESGMEKRALRLYYIHEISRVNTENSYARPIMTGAAIGAAVGLVASAFVEASGSNGEGGKPTALAVAGVFAGIGAGLGLLKAADSHTTVINLGSMTNPEKVVAIQDLIDGNQDKGD